MSLQAALRVVLALGMVAIGFAHFANPEPFVRIVPGFLPAPLALVYLSGVFEVLLGVAILPARTRRLAGFGLVALYIAVFPANIYMAVNQIQLSPGGTFPVWAMWARLPLQLVLIAWALWAAQIIGRPSVIGRPGVTGRKTDDESRSRSSASSRAETR